MSAAQDRHLSIREELALRTLAFYQRTNMAEQRRRAIQERADRALEDPEIAALVDLMVESQIERAVAKMTGERP